MDLTSGYPLWPIADGLIETYPRLDDHIACDVAIIGGGITGALVAQHLAEAGVETVVIDKREIGWGSTAASTAVLQYEIDVSLAELSEKLGAAHASRAYIACRDAIGKLERLVARLPGDSGFERKKSLYFANNKRGRKELRADYELRRALGLDVDWLDESDIAERFAFRGAAALLTRDAAQVDAYALCHGLLRDGVGRGLRVFDRTTVDEIKPADNGVKIRTADGCVVRARHVVFATGYETRDFLPNLPVRLASTYALATEPRTRVVGWGEDQCVIWEHARPYVYLRTTSDGRVIIGGEDEDFRDPRRRDRLLPKKTKRLAERLHEFFPESRFEVAFAWTGTFGETKDGLAYIGEHPDWPRAFFALGYGGNGITFSLLAAEIIRDAILGRPNGDADLFRFDR